MENEDNKQKSTKKVYQKWWFWVIVAVIIIGTFGSSNTTNTVDTSKSKTTPVQANETQLDEGNVEIIEQQSQSSSIEQKEEDQPQVTMGQKNALSQAKSYLSFSAFSYTGLIKQLEFEGFTNEEATYGADNCGADWNEQAAKSAKSYLDFSSFSRSGLIKQLEYEGFTAEQAEYGATAVGY